jgi:hypothetical protein
MSKLSQWKDTYNKLRSQTSVWSRSADVLMSQSLLLLANDATDRCDELLEYWEVCHKSASLWSGLRGELFNTVGVLAMIAGIAPEEIVRRTKSHRNSMSASGLTGFFSGSSLYTKGTALFMALHMVDPSDILSKMNVIMGGWKKDHPVVTGNNDLFYGLLHAMQDTDPTVQVKLTEDCFQALKRGGYIGWGPWADELQASAQVVALWPQVDVDALEQHFSLIIKLLKKEFSFFAPNLRPSAALLAACGLPIEETVSQAIQYYKLMDAGSRENRLILSINLVLLEQFENDQQLNKRLIAIVVGLVYAQEIATAVAAAAAVAAT